MTSDEALEIANDLVAKHQIMRTDLVERQPRTTREEWEALQSLHEAAAWMISVSVWLARHDEKVKS